MKYALIQYGATIVAIIIPLLIAYGVFAVKPSGRLESIFPKQHRGYFSLTLLIVAAGFLYYSGLLGTRIVFLEKVPWNLSPFLSMLIGFVIVTLYYAASKNGWIADGSKGRVIGKFFMLAGLFVFAAFFLFYSVYSMIILATHDVYYGSVSLPAEYSHLQPVPTDMSQVLVEIPTASRPVKAVYNPFSNGYFCVVLELESRNQRSSITARWSPPDRPDHEFSFSRNLSQYDNKLTFPLKPQFLWKAKESQQ